MKKKFLLSCLLIIMAWLPSFAQIQEPVKFKTELKTISDTEAQIVFTGNIDAGWHVYSTDLPSGGPISATFNVEKIQGAELMGKLTPQGKEIENFDKVFEMKLRYFENTATFVQKFKITDASYQIEGYLEYGACNDENCLPPTEVPFSFSGKGNAATATVATSETKAETVNQPAAENSVAETTAIDSAATVALSDNETSVQDYWTPVIKELNSYGETTSQQDRSWIYIFFAGFIGG